MAKTFMQMVAEAMAEIDGIAPHEVHKRLELDADALLVVESCWVPH
jgi:hypothetical protein